MAELLGAVAAVAGVYRRYMRAAEVFLVEKEEEAQ
jgi:hypothetical protein